MSKLFFFASVSFFFAAVFVARNEAACTFQSTRTELSDCQTFVTVGSTETSPVSECCSELKTLGHSCLCDLIHDTTAPSNVNLTRAVSLPELCGLPGPSSCT